MFGIVDGKPIRVSRSSAQSCLDYVDIVWKRKMRFYADAEKAKAEAICKHARKVYRRIVSEAVAD